MLNNIKPLNKVNKPRSEDFKLITRQKFHHTLFSQIVKLFLFIKTLPLKLTSPLPLMLPSILTLIFLLEFMLGDEIMPLNYQVGEFYNAKTFKESGFNFPDGEYKLKIIREGFPEDPVNKKDELAIAEEQWLEGLEGSDQYKTDLDGNWYYFEFPINDEGIDYMWVPESVVVEVFE